MHRLHRWNDAKPIKPRDIFQGHNLSMFDPVPVIGPGVFFYYLLKDVQRLSVGGISDGVNSHLKAGLMSPFCHSQKSFPAHSLETQISIRPVGKPIDH